MHRVASQFGYGVESARLCVRQADVDDGVATGVRTTEARRVRELEQEARELRRANKIVKRAASFCGSTAPKRSGVLDSRIQHVNGVGLQAMLPVTLPR